MVATWFSTQHPVSGGRETLSVPFVRGKQGLAGGHLSVTIRYGRHTIHLTGGTTNARGIASVTFAVPRGLKGTVLHAVSTIMFKGQRYLGSNHVRVAG